MHHATYFRTSLRPTEIFLKGLAPSTIHLVLWSSYGIEDSIPLTRDLSGAICCHFPRLFPSIHPSLTRMNRGNWSMIPLLILRGFPIQCFAWSPSFHSHVFEFGHMNILRYQIASLRTARFKILYHFFHKEVDSSEETAMASSGLLGSECRRRHGNCNMKDQIQLYQ